MEMMEASTEGGSSPQGSEAKKLRRCWGMVSKRERWSLTWRGRFFVLVAGVVFGVLLVRSIHPFLAITSRESTDVLVVEGWIHDYAVLAAANEFKKGSYKRVFTTGGPVSGLGGYISDYSTSASIGAGRLRGAGLPGEVVQMVPSKVSGRDRTYSSAVSLREWFREHGVSPEAVNIVTEEFHARRTRLLFQKAFGDGIKVGIVAIPSPDYDASRWWRYSEGVREILGETIAYIYVRLFFWPDESSGNE